jgi:hypothetical protein
VGIFEQINPKYPDFKHKLTKEASWINNWRNPSWIAETVDAASQDHTQSSETFIVQAGRETIDLEDCR